MSDQQEHRSGLPWPLTVIDFEASSLEDGGYPIEVGLAVWPTASDAIFGWSTLIKPCWEWAVDGHWSCQSSAIHGIARGDLAAGLPPRNVARLLNELIREPIVWCDGGPFDTYWARRLFDAAEIEPTFHLVDWQAPELGLSRPARERAMNWYEGAETKHRAQDDALKLLLAIAHGMGLSKVSIRELQEREPALAGSA